MSFKMRCPKCGSYSFDIERDRSMRTSSLPVAGGADLIFSCRCGKQLFGEQVVAERDRQLKAYEADTEARARDEAAAEARRREQAAVEARRKEAAALAAKKREDEERARAERAAEAVRQARADAERREAEPRAAAAARGAEPARAPAPPPAAPPPPAAEVAAPPVAPPAPPPAAPPAAEAPAAEAAPAEGTADADAAGNGEIQICLWPGCGKPARPGSKYCSRDCSNKNARARYAQRRKDDGIAA